MSKTQTPKHEIPKDWSNITDKEAIERINYLLKHYKECDIKKQGDIIIINDITVVYRVHPIGELCAIGYPLRIYSKGSEIYPLIKKLFNLCKAEVEKRESQKIQKQDKTERIIKVACICVTIIAVVIGAYEIKKEAKINKQEQAKQIKIENEMKRYEKTLPYYNEYLQTKQQIQNRRDSLEKVY